MANKYQAYAEYKDSGVEWLGSIPINWKLKRIKYINKIIAGYAFKSSDFSPSGVKVIKISNVSNSLFDWSDRSYLPMNFLEEQRNYIPPEKSLIFAMTRPIVSGGIKVALLNTKEKYLVNQRVGFLKPSLKENQRYLM